MFGVGVRDKIMNLIGVLALMGSEEQGFAFYDEVKSQAKYIRLAQSYAAPSEMDCPRGPGEFEIEQGAIDNLHAKIYAAIFEAAADGIAQRYGNQILKKYFVVI